jgi:SAM-dependent methyltransferase
MPALVVAAALKSGHLVTDRVFDRIYPPELRFISRQYWTPVAVAARAAQLLVEAGATRILDIGSGPGKFCITGALTTDAVFTGVEQRQQLVEVARAVAYRIGAERARFLHADVLRFPFRRFDGFYLYNPFFEYLAVTGVRIDDAIGLSVPLFERSVLTTTRKLARLPVGVAVATYHGFGGVMPNSYSRVYQEGAGTDRLDLWIKTKS